MDSKKSRIGILDGFRAVAILSVLLFHYFSRWTPPRNLVSLYPYKGEYNYFGYGNLGVHFFFMISGFVIFFTLDNTNYFASFWKKRLIRLVPSMVIASLITFTVFILFDHSLLFPESHEIKNFLPSFTFITPKLFNLFTSPGIPFDFINGSYWSLWTEIQFYFFASVLFYLNKKQFLRNFILISIVLILINYLLANILTGSNLLHISLPEGALSFYKTWFYDIFNLVIFLPFFAMGVLFYLLFKNRHLNINTAVFVKCSLAVFLLLSIFSGVKLEVRFIYMAMFILFYCFVYYPDKFFIFENKILTTIGICSYFLYLIHENIGVFLINKLGHYFLPAGFIFPLLLMGILILISWQYTEKVDSKINKLLKKSIPVKH